MTTPAELPRPFGTAHTSPVSHAHCWFCGACVLGDSTAPTYAGSDGQVHVICSDCAGDPAKAAEDRERRLLEEERYSFLWTDDDEKDEDAELPVTPEELWDALVEDGVYGQEEEEGDGCVP